MSPADQSHATAAACPECGSPLAASALSCSTCHRLTKGAELEKLAQQARAAEHAGALLSARTFWAQSLNLLPTETVQYQSIQKRIAELDERMRATGSAHSAKWKTGVAGAGPVAALLWKFKAVALLVLTKGKLLLLGLTKITTLLTMFASFGLYWGLYGWPFALGLVLSIYIHEMGHVMALRRFGIPAGPPVFIPGFGALIQLRRFNITPIQDSRIGLAGPLYGFGTALFALGVYMTTGAKLWGAIAHFGAVINLFNLIPVWQLDGARGLHSLTKQQRTILLGVAAVLWLITSAPMLFLVGLALAFRLFGKDAATAPDNTALVQYAGLLTALSAVVALTPGT